MPIKIVCPNCSKKFMTEYLLCPSCNWDRSSEIADVIEEDVEVPAEDDQGEDDQGEDDEAEPADLEMVPGPGFKNLEELNVGQLRPMARDLGVKKWYALDKQGLIAEIEKVSDV